MKWFLLAFNKYAQFSGRSRRKEFWMFTLFTIIFSIIATGLDYTFGFKGTVKPISLILTLVLFIPGLAVGIRRMHDVGNNGTVYIILNISAILINFLVYIKYDMGVLMIGLSAIMLITAIISLVYLVKDSNPEENQYGLNPKLDDLDPQFES